jgi:N-succinyldiaminopimelate aminotransferase
VNAPESRTSSRLRPFGTTIFSEMTALAQQHGAINLAQGFPDFEGPPELITAAQQALAEGHNQYARSPGHPALVQALAAKYRDRYGLLVDPMKEVVVFAGATEGIACALLGLLDPGDEVVGFEPFYDSYPVAIALAGGVARWCPLRFPSFALDVGALERCFTPSTKVLLLNTPHNPTGKVFTREELLAIAEVCRRRDVVVVADEVYEHLTYDGAVHLPIATLPGMRERTLTLSSGGKTYSMTGWKIGWGVGPAPLVAAAQAAQQYVTFAIATPLQVAMARAIERLGDAYFAQLQREYAGRRAFLLDLLRQAGFAPAAPQGAYFVLADFTTAFPPERHGDDRALARRLVVERGVAAIPPSVFYAACEDGRRLLRFAFCKKMETLLAAAGRLLAGGGFQRVGSDARSRE